VATMPRAGGAASAAVAVCRPGMPDFSGPDATGYRAKPWL